MHIRFQGMVKWWVANQSILPSGDANYVDHTTKNEVDHNYGQLCQKYPGVHTK